MTNISSSSETFFSTPNSCSFSETEEAWRSFPYLSFLSQNPDPQNKMTAEFAKFQNETMPKLEAFLLRTKETSYDSRKVLLRREFNISLFGQVVRFSVAGPLKELLELHLPDEDQLILAFAETVKNGSTEYGRLILQKLKPAQAIKIAHKYQSWDLLMELLETHSSIRETKDALLWLDATLGCNNDGQLRTLLRLHPFHEKYIMAALESCREKASLNGAWLLVAELRDSPKFDGYRLMVAAGSNNDELLAYLLTTGHFDLDQLVKALEWSLEKDHAYCCSILSNEAKITDTVFHGLLLAATLKFKTYSLYYLSQNPRIMLEDAQQIYDLFQSTKEEWTQENGTLPEKWTDINVILEQMLTRLKEPPASFIQSEDTDTEIQHSQ